MKVRDVLERLGADGWRVMRTRGSHRQLHHPAKRGTVTVSGHANDDFHPATLKSIWRQPRWRIGMSEYTVIYEPGERNWSAYVPDLPGCIATGTNRAETETLIREAIEFHLEGLRLTGEPVPPPHCEAGLVAVAA